MVESCSEYITELTDKTKAGGGGRRRAGVDRSLVRRTPDVFNRQCIEACGSVTDGGDGNDATVRWCSCFTAFTQVNDLVIPILVINRWFVRVDALTVKHLGCLLKQRVVD
jgi:hypothetical protein